ncbi:amino acid adenylation domain-containing protein, partial [Chitinophaga eiseniae]
QEGATLFMGLLSTVYALLYRYTNQTDIIIGSPVAGRDHIDLEPQIGCFLNTVALRTQVAGEGSYLDLLHSVKDTTLQAYEHQLYPFDELIETLELQRDMSRSALFDVMVVLQNTGEKVTTGFNDQSVRPLEGVEDVVSKFDLTLTFREENDTIRFNIEYSTDLFEKETIVRLAGHFQQLLAVMLQQPESSLNCAVFINTEEQEKLYAFNPAPSYLPSEKTIITLFEEQVLKTPQNTALVFEDVSLSYEELNKTVNRFSRYLRTKYNIQPDDLIAIMLERSEWMVIGMLAILKSGAAYVPVDVQYPEARIAYILEDTRCKVTVDEKEVAAFLAVQDQYDDNNPVEIAGPGHLAYVIYTSGTTGKPKGVLIEHVSLIDYSDTYRIKFGIADSDVILQLSSISFDIHIEEVFPTLISGAVLVMGRNGQKDMDETVKLVYERKVTVISATPLVLKELNDSISGVTNLRLLISGGERFNPYYVAQFVEKISIVDGYGPTECTVCSTYHDIVSLDQAPAIGKPAPNRSVYIVNEQCLLQPLGIVGEICISGIGLARGYLNKPELTAEKFVDNPFRPGELMYKSGDLGRWLPNGDIEFVGRKDDQLKIRGYRIEAGEIEATLQSFPGVTAAVVTAWLTPQGDKELVAYLVSEQQVQTSEVTAFLGNILPAYMVPYYYVVMDALPLNSNGKVDRRQLPSPATDALASDVTYHPPVNPVQSALVQLWQELLNRNQVGIHDDFFRLGGHSLKATRLVSQIYKTLEVKIGLKDIFLHPVLEDLAALIMSMQRTAYANIPVVAPSVSYPLSSSQRRLWVISQLEGGNAAYNMPGVYVFEGTLNTDALEAAFYSLIARHEILRTVFREDESGEVRQYILDKDSIGFALQEEDLRACPDADEALMRGLNRVALTPFSLSEGPLLRACLYRQSDEKSVFACTMHHIVSDGWSMGIMMKELLYFYNAAAAGTSLSLPPLRLQYKDYAAWQQQQLSGPLLRTYRSYWHQQLEGELPVLELPADKIRTAVKSYRGSSITHVISEELTDQLKSFCLNNGSTLFMGLLSCVNALLYCYTEQHDIIIGSPVAGREHADLEDQIGFYVNTLPLRTRFSGSDSFLRLLHHVRQVTVDAYTYQLYPFDMLVDELDLPRDTSRNPLFDVMVVLQEAAEDNRTSPVLEGVQVMPYPEDTAKPNKFDVLFSFREIAGRLHLTIDHNSDLYNSNKVRKMAVHLEQLLVAVLKNPDIELERIAYLDAGEETKLISGFNAIPENYDTDKTVTDLFIEQVHNTPDKIALVYGSKVFTYRQVYEKAAGLSAYLYRQGEIQAGDIIAIHLPRGEWQVISILAVMFAGAAYLPIDTRFPAERVDFIVSESNCRFVIDENFLNTFEVLQPDTDQSVLFRHASSDDPAYVIYTSGSTGKPKGVVSNHRALVTYLRSIAREYDFTADERVVQISNISFDASVEQLFLTLTSGAALYLINEDELMNADALREFIGERGITHLHTVPALLETFVLPENHWVKRIVAAGESCPVALVNKFAGPVDFFNKYGPTEATISVTIFKASGEMNKAEYVPIGRPLSHVKVFIMNRKNMLVPEGVTGEICIRTTALATGYLHQPELTAEKFIPAPFGEDGYMYRTGDLGYWRADGNIILTGRRDDQVKIRGYRIETGEVESVLRGYEGVDSAVVYVRKDHQGNNQLMACFVAACEIDIPSLRAFMSSSLPVYMQPVFYKQIAALPLLSNGKIHRGRLPEPDSLHAEVVSIAPRTETETSIAAIWEEVLGKKQIGVNDNFFQLGGHSLKAVRVLQLMQATFRVKIELSVFYMDPYVEALATEIDHLRWLSAAENSGGADKVII